jgi:hypothetical protein
VPDFQNSTALTALQQDFRPLANWKYRVLPIAAARWAVTILMRATTLGIQASVDAGGQNMVQRCQVQGAGVAGTTPVPQTTPVIQFFAAALDELFISAFETLSGTPTLDTYINVEPT